ncbi:MAG: adenine phosphoribosyltransferase [Gaiellaceae bacterium MAG52_C11]|nr:adenine phosphoribosyltransferase [Candidatus Gaiellasilicea maunaloa]
MSLDLRTLVREVPDFPQPGVGFKDISPLLAHPAGLQQAISDLAEWGKAKRPDLVVGAEARGFILGAAIAREIGCGFVPARRPGKLPPDTVSVTYALEYGQNALELHPSSFWQGVRVLVHDDVLATGGTVEAIGGLIEQLGGEVVGVAFIIDLTFLNGRERLAGYDVHSLIDY